jgi:hypothetical protein
MQAEVLADLGGRFQRDASLAAQKAIENGLGYTRFLSDPVLGFTAVENGVLQLFY